MTFHDLLDLCIQRTPRHSANNASQIIGVSRSTFSNWYVKSEHGKLPHPDYWPKIAELSGQSVQKVTFTILAEMAKTPEASKVYEGLAA